MLPTARLYHLREAAGQCSSAGSGSGIPADFEGRYRAWCASGGFTALSEDSETGDDIDLAKVRLALEAHPRALEPQLRALLLSRQGGNVLTDFAAPREAEVGPVQGTVLQLLAVPPEAGALQALEAAIRAAGCAAD